MAPFPKRPPHTFTNVESTGEHWTWDRILARARDRAQLSPMGKKVPNHALKYIRYMHEVPVQGLPTHAEVPIVLNADFITVKVPERGEREDFWFEPTSTNVEFDWCQWLAFTKNLGEAVVSPGVRSLSLVARLDTVDVLRMQPQSMLVRSGRGPPAGIEPRVWTFKMTRIDGQVFFIKPGSSGPPVVSLQEDMPQAQVFPKRGEAHPLRNIIANTHPMSMIPPMPKRPAP